MRAIKNSLWLVSEKVLRLILGILVTSQIARYYGISLFGEYSLILAFITIITVVNSLGFNRVFIREITKRNKNIRMANKILITSLVLRLLCAFVLIFISLFISLFIDNNFAIFYVIATLSLIFISFDIFDLLNQAFQTVSIMSKFRSLTFIIGCITKLTIIFNELDFIWLVLSVVLDFVLVSLALIYATKVNKIRYSFSLQYFSFPVAKILLRESWPEVFAGLFAILYMRLDLIMLKFYCDSEQVGVYSAAIRISEAWYFIPSAFISATFPLIVSWEKNNKPYYEKGVQHIFCFMAYLSVFVAIVLTFLSDFIVVNLFGSSFQQSATVLSIHIWAGFFVAMGTCSGSIMAVEGKLKYNLHRNIVGVLSNIIFNILLIPEYGVEGAAYATLMSLAISFYLYDLTNSYLRRLFLIKTKAITLKSLWALMNFIYQRLIIKNTRYL